MKKIIFVCILFVISCVGGQKEKNSFQNLLESFFTNNNSQNSNVGQSTDFNNITPPNASDVVIGSNNGQVPNLPPNLDLSFISAPGGNQTLIRTLKLEIDGNDYSNASIFHFAEKQIGTSEKKLVRLKNVGNDSVTIVSTEITSQTNQFQFINLGIYNGTQNIILSPNQFVEFEIEFQPTNSGSKSGSLRIVSDDPNQPEKLLELRGIGSTNASAIVMKPYSVVSRSDSIIIEFSHSVDQDSICQNLQNAYGFPGINPYGGSLLKITKNPNDENQAIVGNCYWNSHRQLVLDPLDVLEPNTRYYIILPDARLYGSNNTIQCVRRIDEGNCIGQKLVTEFITEPAFYFQISLQNGYSIHPTPNFKSAIINKVFTPEVTIQTTISEFLEADEIKIKKLNNPPTTSFIPWQTNINLSTISDLNLRPSDGANTYYLEIKKGAKLYYRVFGFHYGTTSPNPNEPNPSTARVNMGTGNQGINVLGRLLERLFKSNGSFTTLSDNFRIGGKIFSDPIQEFLGTTENNCARVKPNSLSGIKEGHILRGVSLAPNTFVKSIVTNGSIPSGDGCPNTSTFTTAPLLILSRAANDGFGETNSNLKITAGPDIGKVVNLTSGSNQISFDNSNDLYPGVFINHPSLQAGTTLLNQVSGNVWTVSNSSSASVMATTVNIGRTFMQNPKRTGTVLTGVDALGQTCLSNPNDYGTNKELNHLLSIGPFCRINWSWGGFLANGKSDVYVTNMTIENTTNTIPNDNLLVQLIPAAGATQNGQVNINLNGKRLKGTLRLFMHSGGGLAGGLANGAVYDVDFLMSPSGGCNAGAEFLNYDPNINFHLAQAFASFTIPGTNGAIDLTILNQPGWVNNPNATEFKVAAWNSAICAYNVRTIKPGTFDSIIQAVLESVIPGIQWRVVQGVIRDTIQSVTPNILNALFYQMRKDTNANGIDINLPNYLPTPFNKTLINIGVNLKQENTNRIHADGIDLTAATSVSVCQKSDPNSTVCLNRNDLSDKPSLPHQGFGFENSFLMYSNGTPPRSQLTRSSVNGNQGTGKINDPDGSGVLVGVHSDTINQTLYHFWWNGILNLKLNQSFADQIKTFRGDGDRLFQIFQILLKADSILKVLAPGRNSIQFKNSQGQIKTIQKTDDIFFKVEPLLPPNVRFSNTNQSVTVNNGKSPLMDFEWTDLIFRIYGKQGNDEYLLTTLKVGISTKLLFGAGKFTSAVGCPGLNPSHCNGSENDYYQVSAVQFNLCDDNNDIDIPNANLAIGFKKIDCDAVRNGFNDGNPNNDLDLFYSLEVIDTYNDNPSGLNPDGIKEVFQPTIQKLIIPVINYVLEYVPLEKKNASLAKDNLYGSPNYSYTTGTKEDPNASGNKIAANCGIRINDLVTLPYPTQYSTLSGTTAESNPYLLINLKLSNYTFWGNCNL
ncbi:hypothetical protein [Leptospira jelokensis]|uniref:Abnormal spindle-like microcephaly-associated protein ASH domain-containing protein n=1 Tax=Leptospira jelokensis TaxID=2484931 RepID=A0A4Z0ZXD5_9LEPT|nr:hypothetical protein [Leptospira jelokensis]TGL75949.1 hypothetical protein EHQ62_00970 [Leptospira jelokensis]